MDTKDADVTTRYFYKPEGVVAFLGIGANSLVGIVDETTVFKYPHAVGDEEELAMLAVEAQILTTIGPHKHIIGFKGQRDDGLLLERALHGSMAHFLRDYKPILPQKIVWARQAAEAVAVTHNAGVLHCDISVNNILIDRDLTVKLCDFQGRLLWPDGTVNKNGLSCNSTKSYMPGRPYPDYADRKTDIFALGSAFYYIMQGHEPFPELDSHRDEEQIDARFRAHQFPEVRPLVMSRVIHRCWAGQYESDEAVLQDLESAELTLWLEDSGMDRVLGIAKEIL